MNELHSVLRTENKYLLTQAQALLCKRRVASILRADPNNNLSGYLVRSLYFDTVEDSDYFDKIDGLEDRRKLRLRIYHPDAAFAKLELKEKSGAYQRKRSLTVTREQAELLAAGDFTPLNQSDHPFAIELRNLAVCHTYRPKSIVEYQRCAFLHPTNNIRITFDFNVRAGLVPQSFFLKSPLLCPVLPPENVLLEVKFDRFLLSYIKDAVNVCDCSPVALSKYCMAKMVGI